MTSATSPSDAGGERGAATPPPTCGPVVPVADAMPTPDEEAAAERAAEDVDIAAAGEHAQEMYERGADVRGEGEIEPPA